MFIKGMHIADVAQFGNDGPVFKWQAVLQLAQLWFGLRGPNLSHKWPRSGKTYLGHQRSVILCGIWAESVVHGVGQNWATCGFYAVNSHNLEQ